MDHTLRDRILSEPDVILEDPDVMRALVAANERSMGGNIVDLRGIAMERLEARLDRLEDTHRNVIAAAYENLTGTNQIHRAILQLLATDRFEDFLAELSGEVARVLRLDAVRLVLESSDVNGQPDLAQVEKVLCVVATGHCDTYASTSRKVVLRQTQSGDAQIFGTRCDDIRSEACLHLDLGDGRLPAMLVFGSEDPHMFTPQQGTDLLEFFGNVFERLLQRWLG